MSDKNETNNQSGSANEANEAHKSNDTKVSNDSNVDNQADNTKKISQSNELKGNSTDKGSEETKESKKESETNKSDKITNTERIIPLDIKEIIKSLDDQNKSYWCCFDGTIAIFVAVLFIFIFSNEKFKPNTPFGITLFGIILLILLLLLIAIIYNYIKIFEISRKKTELIELDAILKSIDENRKQHFLRAYLKKNVLKDE